MNDTRQADIPPIDESRLPDVRFGFVLTREGRAWSEDALLALTDTVNEKWPPDPDGPADSGILWEAGYLINDPLVLADVLEKHPDAFVALSMKNGTAVLPGNKNGTPTAEYLKSKAGTGQTSWQILTAMWAESRRQEG